jgi:hypothetical protein
MAQLSEIYNQRILELSANIRGPSASPTPTRRQPRTQAVRLDHQRRYQARR